MAKGTTFRGDYLNFLRFGAVESAAATYTQTEVDTNLSAERGVFMEIHSIELFTASLALLDEVAAGGNENVTVQITRETKGSITTANDADLIHISGLQLSRSSAIGTDAGPLYYLYPRDRTFHFPVPIPYVKPSIFIGVQGSDAAGTWSIAGRIGYTLREISRSDFLELLVALQ